MDLDAAAKLARELLVCHELEAWGFGFNRRKRAMGLCRWDRKRIELSIYFVQGNTEAAVRETLLHEIAHALAGPDAGHGPRWKAVCQELGIRARATGQARMPRGKWRARCAGCGYEYARHQRPAAGATYWCSGCGPGEGRLRFDVEGATGSSGRQ